MAIQPVNLVVGGWLAVVTVVVVIIVCGIMVLKKMWKALVYPDAMHRARTDGEVNQGRRLDYTRTGWHSTDSLRDSKLSIHLNLNVTHGMYYLNVLFVAELESWETRRTNISRSTFQDFREPNSCLCHLIPPVPHMSVTTTQAKMYHSLSKTSFTHQKYCSFINVGVHHYKPTKWGDS